MMVKQWLLSHKSHEYLFVANKASNIKIQSREKQSPASEHAHPTHHHPPRFPLTLVEPPSIFFTPLMRPTLRCKLFYKCLKNS
mmetsp:Transcript_374/g.788  ORF Transcript_374/g.788 Transcript_374/m.788 type:complete len:83 (-) Transcript_374:95-343(-)